jgi:hypothetical protein
MDVSSETFDVQRGETAFRFAPYRSLENPVIEISHAALR